MRLMESHSRLKAIMAAGIVVFALVPDIAWAGFGNGPAPTPFAIFKTNPEGKRDRFQHLLFLAETEPLRARRGKAYRHLGDILVRAKRGGEALRAYEAGALQGDSAAANIIIEAYGEGRYKPRMPSEFITIAVMPKAEEGQVGAALLMADLLSSGRLKGKGYHSSTYWLELAASYGSSRALVRLAEAAERNGKIASAAKYFARADKSMSTLDRALAQAKIHYLGTDGKPNAKLGFAWLDYASGLDTTAAGTLAAKLYRQSTVEADRTKFLAMAESAGVEVGGNGGYATRLAAAKTPAERDALLAEIKLKADAGDPDASAAQWRLLTDAGVPASETERYLLAAVKGGNASAIRAIGETLSRLDPADPKVTTLVALLDTEGAKGNAAALSVLGSLYAIGGPVSADRSKSLQLYRAAADVGDVDAQLRVGLFFAQNNADAGNLDLARHYLKAAAEQGSASAKAYLDALPTA